MNQIDYLTILRRRWAVIVGMVVFAVAIAWLTTVFVPHEPQGVTSYQASSVVLQTGALLNKPPLNLDTVSSIVTLQPVVDRVARSTGYTGDPRRLAGDVQAVSDKQHALLTITATSTDPNEAKVLANSFAAQLIAYLNSTDAETRAEQSRFLGQRIEALNHQIQALEHRLPASPTTGVAASPGASDLLNARLQAKIALLNSYTQQQQALVGQRIDTFGLHVVQKATVASPVSASGVLVLQSEVSRLVIGALIGLVLGLMMALILERFDTRIRTKEAAEAHFRVPVLADIPAIPRRRRSGVIAASHPESPHAEAFRLLGAEVATTAASVETDGNGGDARRSRTLLVTSPSRGEGKTTVVANLAAALAEAGKRVLVISCDLRHPYVHRLFGVPNELGLVDVLQSANGRPQVQRWVWDTSVAGVWLVPSGTSSAKPGELLNSDAMRRVLSEARRAADVVLLDTPGILTEGDAAYLVPGIDDVLVVARAGRTTADGAERTTGVLGRLGARVVGVALNEA